MLTTYKIQINFEKLKKKFKNVEIYVVHCIRHARLFGNIWL